MALSHSREARNSLSRLIPALERRMCSFVEDKNRALFSSHTGQGEVSKWRKLDSRNFGIERSMISIASWTVLRILREKGFEAYLVGGCVRDLLLNKVPKDFDVITTGGLKQVKRKFHNAMIVGKRFPICMVTVKGSVVEVSSFETVANESGGKTRYIPQKPKGCDPSDFRRWKNSLDRDFTVNSLFFDPFVNTIYDYTNAMMDLKSLKLRTVKAAHLSFKEDQARILRGLRLAARLNLSFSEEAEDALYSLSSLVADLSTSRILMEVNYMLSYGAAESSLLLLKRFQLLDMLLPFHAAYLSEQVHNQLGVRSLMLMKLFSNLDQLITCDQPCQECLWVAILAFHLAIFSYPQHPAVVLTFASLLYHRTLEESITVARQNALSTKIYIPEIIGAPDDLSDDEIEERLTLFVQRVKNSVDVLINKNCLLESMARFPEFPCSGLVFVPQKMGQKVKHIFDILSNGVSSVRANRSSEEIHHRSLKEGNVNEIRFVLGMIITRTLVDSKMQTHGAVVEAGKDDHLQVTKPLGTKITRTKVDSKKQTRGTVAEAGKDDRLGVTKPLGSQITRTVVHNKKQTHGEVAEAGKDDRLRVTKPLGTQITRTLVHSKKQTLGEVAEAGKDYCLQVTNPPQKKLDVSERTGNTTAHLAKLFSVNKNEKKRSSTSSNFEKLDDSATKKKR